MPRSHHDFRFVVQVGDAVVGEFRAKTADEREVAELAARELAVGAQTGADDVTVLEYYRGAHDGEAFEVVLSLPAKRP